MNQKAFPLGQVSDLDTAIIAVCDDLFPDHCEFFFAHFKVSCLSCCTSGQVSVPLFDTMLIVNLEDDTVDLAQMIACRNPRLALLTGMMLVSPMRLIVPTMINCVMMK